VGKSDESGTKNGHKAIQAVSAEPMRLSGETQRRGSLTQVSHSKP
jgi:hypothetical protein